MSDLPLCISRSPYPSLLPTPFPFTGFRSASWLGFPSPIRLYLSSITQPPPLNKPLTPVTQCLLPAQPESAELALGVVKKMIRWSFATRSLTRPDSEVVTWKNVPLEETALYSTMVQAFGKYERTMNIRTMELAGC